MTTVQVLNTLNSILLAVIPPRLYTPEQVKRKNKRIQKGQIAYKAKQKGGLSKLWNIPTTTIQNTGNADVIWDKVLNKQFYLLYH